MRWSMHKGRGGKNTDLSSNINLLEEQINVLRSQLYCPVEDMSDYQRTWEDKCFILQRENDELKSKLERIKEHLSGSMRFL